MRGRASFLALRRNGVRGRSGPITVAFAPGVPGDPAQVGYAIGRHVGNAVVRNRLRRRLRGALSELVRMHDAALRGGLYVITPSAAAVSSSFSELAASLEGALRKAGQRSQPTGAAR